MKQGSGAGVWLGIIGVLLLVGGAGVWFYAMRGHGLRATSTIQVAAAEPTPPAMEPSPQPLAQPSPAPVRPAPVSSAPVAHAQPEVIPPNPDLAHPDPAPPTQPNPPPVETGPIPPTRAKPANPTSGVLHASVEVAQNGEVVFENLPGARLKFTFDRNLWRPTISHQLNGTQTLVMRSLKPGLQTTCDVRWEIAQ